MKKMNYIISLSFLLCSGLTQAQTLGTLDDNFGSEGFALTNYETDSAEYLEDLICLQNGKVLLGGIILQSGYFNLLVSRLNTNGTTDLSFGKNGYWTFGFGASSDKVKAILELSDGKIILIGTTWTAQDNTRGFIMRLTADGQLDQSFGEGSKGYTLFTAGANTYCTPDDIVLYQGSFYIAASVYNEEGNSDFGLFKFSQAGALVTSFASNGSNLIDVLGNETVTSLDVGSDGTFIIGGTSVDINGAQWGTIVKLNSYGLTTTAFDGAGYFVYNKGSDLNTIMDVKYDHQGRIVAVGSEGKQPDRNGMVFRFTKDGMPDEEFSSDGELSSDIGFQNGIYLTKLFIDANDHILATGSMQGQSYKDIYVLKLTENGAPNFNFGSQGDVNYPFPIAPTFLNISGADMDTNGNLVLGGTTTISGYDAFNISAARIHHWADQRTASMGGLLFTTMTVYPNPCRDLFHIEVEGPLKEVVLCDVQGRELQRWDDPIGTSIPLPPHIGNGYYLVRCTTSSASYSGRIMVQR